MEQPEKFSELSIEKQRDDIYRALCGNALTHEVAAWLSDVHVRIRQCEKALLKAGLATAEDKGETA